MNAALVRFIIFSAPFSRSKNDTLNLMKRFVIDVDPIPYSAVRESAGGGMMYVQYQDHCGIGTN